MDVEESRRAVGADLDAIRDKAEAGWREMLSDKGLTIRDFYAGLSLVGILANPAAKDVRYEKLAHDAFEMANAMVHARHP